jgi:hypothetical protein
MKLSGVPDDLCAEQGSELADELSIPKKQSKTLQRSAYQRMSIEVASEYDRHCQRIGEIFSVIEKFKPSR